MLVANLKEKYLYNLRVPILSFPVRLIIFTVEWINKLSYILTYSAMTRFHHPAQFIYTDSPFNRQWLMLSFADFGENITVLFSPLYFRGTSPASYCSWRKGSKFELFIVTIINLCDLKSQQCICGGCWCCHPTRWQSNTVLISFAGTFESTKGMV